MRWLGLLVITNLLTNDVFKVLNNYLLWKCRICAKYTINVADYTVCKQCKDGIVYENYKVITAQLGIS